VTAVYDGSPGHLAVLAVGARTIRNLAIEATPSMRTVRMVRALGRMVCRIVGSSSPCMT
jgi:hypothetical protein